MKFISGGDGTQLVHVADWSLQVHLLHPDLTRTTYASLQGAVGKIRSERGRTLEFRKGVFPRKGRSVTTVYVLVQTARQAGIGRSALYRQIRGVVQVNFRSVNEYGAYLSPRTDSVDPDVRETVTTIRLSDSRPGRHCPS